MPSLMSFPVVLIVISCDTMVQESFVHGYSSPYLSAFVDKDEFDAVVWPLGNLGDLRR